MKFLLPILLIASYTIIGVFGAFGMHAQHDMNMAGHEMSTNNCIGAKVKGVDCPKQADPIDFAVFHIDAFKGFSLATFSENAVSALLLVFSSLVLIGLLFFGGHLFTPQLSFNRYPWGNLFPSPPKRRLTRWLALHENSPATL